MNQMLRQHHVRLQDLKPFVRGYDPSKPQTAEEWAKNEGTLYEPGMMIFCLDAVSAPPGLTNFGKRDAENETYRVKDLCVVVSKEDGRSLVVNITASAYELRFLEVLMLEKARKAILDGKDFIFAVAAPREHISEQMMKELHTLGGLYAQGGSRRSLAVDGSGPQEPAMAIISLLGVKLTAGLGKQVLDIGSICHMIYAPDGRQEDKNKALVRSVFQGVLSSQLEKGEGGRQAEPYTPEPYTPPTYSTEPAPSYNAGFGPDQPTFTPEPSYIPEPTFQAGFAAPDQVVAPLPEQPYVAADVTFVPDQSFTQPDPQYAQVAVAVVAQPAEVAAWYQLAHMVEVGGAATAAAPPIASPAASMAAAAAAAVQATPPISAEQMYRSHAALVDEYAQKLVTQFTSDAKASAAEQAAPMAQSQVEQPVTPPLQEQYTFSEQPAPYTESQPVVDPFAPQFQPQAPEPAAEAQNIPEIPEFPQPDYASQFRQDFDAGQAGPQAVEYEQKSREQERELFPQKEQTPDPYTQLAQAAALQPPEAQEPPEFVEAIFETAGRGTLEYNSTPVDELAGTVEWAAAVPQPEPQPAPQAPVEAPTAEELFRQKEFEASWQSGVMPQTPTVIEAPEEETIPFAIEPQPVELPAMAQAEVPSPLFSSPPEESTPKLFSSTQDTSPVQLDEPSLFITEPTVSEVVVEPVSEEPQAPEALIEQPQEPSNKEPVTLVAAQEPVDLEPQEPQSEQPVAQESDDKNKPEGSNTLFERLGQQLSKTPPASPSPRRSSSQLKALPEQVIGAETAPAVWTAESGGSLFEPTPTNEPKQEEAPPTAVQSAEPQTASEASPLSVQPAEAISTPEASSDVQAVEVPVEAVPVEAVPVEAEPVEAEPAAVSPEATEAEVEVAPTAVMELVPTSEADKWQRPVETAATEPPQVVTQPEEPPAAAETPKPEPSSGLPYRRPRPRRGIEFSTPAVESAAAESQPVQPQAEPQTQVESSTPSEEPPAVASSHPEESPQPVAEPASTQFEPTEWTQEAQPQAPDAEPTADGDPADYKHLAEALSGLLDSDATEWTPSEAPSSEPAVLSPQPEEPQPEPEALFTAEPPSAEPIESTDTTQSEEAVTAAQELPPYTVLSTGYDTTMPTASSQSESTQKADEQPMAPPQLAPVAQVSDTSISPPPSVISQDISPVSVAGDPPPDIQGDTQAAPPPPPLSRAPFAFQSSGTTPSAEPPASAASKEPFSSLTDSGVRRANDMSDSAVRRAPGMSAGMSDSGVRRAPDMSDSGVRRAPLGDPAESAVKKKSIDFQEPKVVMNEMATLMSKLEQQVSKAAKRLGNRADELRQRLNTQVEQMIEEAAQVERQSEVTASSLADRLNKQLDEVAEEVRTKVLETTGYGIDSFKRTLGKSHSDIEDDRAHLFESLNDACKEFRTETESLTKKTEFKLQSLIGQKTRELKGMIDVICDAMDDGEHSYTAALQVRFDRFNERMTEEVSSMVTSLERNVRSMTEEIEAARDRAHEKLTASNSDFQQTVNHTVRTAELGLGQKTRNLLTTVILPREKEHRAILQTMSLEMRKQFVEDSSNQSRGQLQGLQSSLSAAREQLQELVEECMSSIDSVGRGQQSGLEEIFKETNDRIERMTSRASRVLQEGEKEINASEAICKRLAETSSVETEPELNEERNTAVSKLQSLKLQAGHELENTIERGCDRLERLSEDMNSELTAKRVELSNGVREAADQGLAKVREMLQEAFEAIQVNKEKYMD